MEDPARFERAIAAIDAANAGDPHTLDFRGQQRPKEQVHAELATTWVSRLSADPSEALLLAARAHHLRRWQLQRNQYPDGRSGYLRWRKELQARHASEAAEILSTAGYGPELIERVRDLIRKRGLGRDPEVQALEDALCLVFVETQLADFATRHDRAKVIDILFKSLRKMSPAGRSAAGEMSLSQAERELLALAVEQLD